MLSLYQSRYGPPAFLELHQGPIPQPAPGQLLIRMRAACLNSWDWDRLTGQPKAWRLFSGLLRPNRTVPGCDLAGTVEAVGGSGGEFNIGDAVMGDLSNCGSWGAFADYVIAPVSELARVPEGLSFEAACCLPQAGVLALQGIRDSLKVAPGQRVLISGAGGGVGTLAIQMAKARGAHVTVADKALKLPALLALGADEALPWPEQPYPESGKTWDRILDVNIGRPMADYARALAPGGVLAVIGGTPGRLLDLFVRGRRIARRQGKTFEIVAQKTTRADLEALMQMALKGEARPQISQVFALKDAVQAFEAFGRGDFVGKIVLQARIVS